MLKLKDSGYDMKFRSEIVFSAKKAYRILLENEKNGIKPLHRIREQMLVDKGAKNSSGLAFWNITRKRMIIMQFCLFPPLQMGY